MYDIYHLFQSLNFLKRSMYKPYQGFMCNAKGKKKRNWIFTFLIYFDKSLKLNSVLYYIYYIDLFLNYMYYCICRMSNKFCSFSLILINLFKYRDALLLQKGHLIAFIWNKAICNVDLFIV